MTASFSFGLPSEPHAPALYRRRFALILGLIGLVVAPALLEAQGGSGGLGGAPPRVIGGPPGGAPPGGGRVELVARFDRDGDGVLNAEERQAARGAIGTQGAGARGPMGGRGGAFAPASEGPTVSQDQVSRFPGLPLYDPTVVRTLFLTFEESGWEEELQAFYNTDVQIPVTAWVDGVEFQDVGVRFRGSSSFRMVPTGSKRPIRLKFDLVHQNQALEGFRTLNLLNAMNDPTLLRTVLYSEIANRYLPAPRVGFVHAVINGESWGIYQNQQQFNRDFLVDHLGQAGGARWQVPGSPNGRGGMEYRGDDIESYRAIYEIDTRDDPARWNDLIGLFKVLNETPLEDLEAALEPVLDIDGVLRFLALDVALVNSDGYWSRASDYNIYQDASGRFHVFPHDMNEGLFAAGVGPGGGAGPGGGGVRLDPLVGLNDAAKPLRSRLLAVPSLQVRYLAYVREIAEKELDWAVLGPRAEALHATIRAQVLADTRKLYSNEAFEQGLEASSNSLRAFAEQRRAYLLSVLPEG